MPATKRFYDAALGAIGIAEGREIGGGLGYDIGGVPLMFKNPIDGRPASQGNGSTLGFRAPDEVSVRKFHSAGLACGGADAGAPAPGDTVPGSYAAYLRDPAGNKICAWCMLGSQAKAG